LSYYLFEVNKVSNDNKPKPSWVDDLFGGRDKVYGENDEKRQSQNASDRALGKGEYPHYTKDANDNWHYSTDGGAKGKHTNAPNSMNPNQEYGEG
jgi:hypothetical protein